MYCRVYLLHNALSTLIQGVLLKALRTQRNQKAQIPILKYFGARRFRYSNIFVERSMWNGFYRTQTASRYTFHPLQCGR